MMAAPRAAPLERSGGSVTAARRPRPSGRFPAGSLVLAAAAVLVGLSPAASRALELHRDAMEHGELWRLLSCHWTHWSVDHLLWDAAVFAVLGAVVERESRIRLWACVLGSAAAVSLGVWLFLPHLESYRGLSGIDSALFACAAVRILLSGKNERRWACAALSAALFAAFLGKTIFEITTGTTLFVDSAGAGASPVPLAHLLGAACGVTAGAAGRGDPYPNSSPFSSQSKK